MEFKQNYYNGKKQPNGVGFENTVYIEEKSYRMKIHLHLHCSLKKNPCSNHSTENI